MRRTCVRCCGASRAVRRATNGPLTQISVLPGRCCWCPSRRWTTQRPVPECPCRGSTGVPLIPGQPAAGLAPGAWHGLGSRAAARPDVRRRSSEREKSPKCRNDRGAVSTAKLCRGADTPGAASFGWERSVGCVPRHGLRSAEVLPDAESCGLLWGVDGITTGIVTYLVMSDNQEPYV
jgi:hypothetical protein